MPIPTLETFVNAPTPHERGWIISSNEISIRWVTRNQAPTDLIKHLACNAKELIATQISVPVIAPAHLVRNYVAASIAIAHQLQAQKMSCLTK